MVTEAHLGPAKTPSLLRDDPGFLHGPYGLILRDRTA